MSFDQNPIRGALCAFAANNWAIFPVHVPLRGGSSGCSCRNPSCTSVGKHPITPRGVLDASDRIEDIAAWWVRWPWANVGLAAGPSRLAIIDIDPDRGGEEAWDATLRRFGAWIEETLQVSTGGGGRHLYYLVPAGKTVRNGANVFGKGIDVRGDGGYVVAPPSVHRSGARYSWLNQRVPLPFPAQMAKAIDDRKRGPTSSRPSAVPEGAVQEGGRNDTLFRLASRLRGMGLSTSEIAATIRQANQERCQPPLPEAEVDRLVQSAGKYLPNE